jgi:PTS system nitrogen regulatory IIA component
MNLMEAFRTECVRAGLEAATKEEALHAIARLAKQSEVLAPIEEEDLFQALREREELGSTAFGEGIAIPHCRISGIDDFVVGLASSEGGVEFDAMDGESVHLFVFIIAPLRESNEHIRLLSAVSQVLRIPGAIEEMVRDKSDETLAETFLRNTRDEVETKTHDSKNLFHVFVQDEERFESLLQVFASMDTCSVQVVEAEQSGTYLSKMPLFAGFWSDADRGFNRIIVALVEKKLTNETIRQLEHACGSALDDANRVAVSVQDVFYASGRIEA